MIADPFGIPALGGGPGGAVLSGGGAGGVKAYPAPLPDPRGGVFPVDGRGGLFPPCGLLGTLLPLDGRGMLFPPCGLGVLDIPNGMRLGMVLPQNKARPIVGGGHNNGDRA